MRRVMFQPNIQSVMRQCARRLVGPFDCSDVIVIEILVEAQRPYFLFAPYAIKIGMDQRQAAAVFLNEHEGGAANHGRIGPQSFRNSPHQGCLSRSHETVQAEDFPSHERRADNTPEAGGFSW